MPVAEAPSARCEILPLESDYRFPTDHEMVEAICHALDIHPEQLRDGRRMRRVNHIVQYVQLYHREARATGSTAGLKKRAAAADALWPDVNEQMDVKRKKNSMWRWEAIAERAGLLRIRDGRGARALQWALLDDWQRYAGASRGYSSVGAVTPGAGCGARRRRETQRQRHERRVRPYCRRVGNKSGSVGRLEAGSGSFFNGEKLSPSGLAGPPTGAPPTDALHAQAGGGVERPSVDAPGGAGGAPAWAAREAEKRRSEGGGAAAEALFEQAFGPPRDGRLANPLPLLIALVRFDRSADALAALNGWASVEGRGLRYLEQLMASWPHPRPPRHAGYFVKPLLAEARRNEKRLRLRRREDQAAARRRRAFEAAELVERLRDPDPARGGHGSPPRPRRGSGARRTGR